MSTTPYQIRISDAELDLLRRKLELARLPSEQTANEQWGEDNGVTYKFMSNTLDFWRRHYDWKKEEARLNLMPQFMTPIDVEGFGTLNIHFVHSKSPTANATPLLFVHGWPGSFAEVEKMLPELNKAGFNVVAPSLPGFGFSSYTNKKGFSYLQHAEVMHKIMLKLGYNSYVVQGGDWGSFIVRVVAFMYPEHVKAMHVNMVPMMKPPQIKDDHAYTPFEQKSLDRREWFLTTNHAYALVQDTKPRTLGFMVHDSPIAMLAWMSDKLLLWSDDYPWTPTEIITWTLLHYFPGPATGFVIYREIPSEIEVDHFVKHYVKVPSGVSAFPRELVPTPRCWAECAMNVVWWKEHPEGGGHFPAYEKPQVLARDMINFFKAVCGSSQNSAQ